MYIKSKFYSIGWYRRNAREIASLPCPYQSLSLSPCIKNAERRYEKKKKMDLRIYACSRIAANSGQGGSSGRSLRFGYVALNRGEREESGLQARGDAEGIEGCSAAQLPFSLNRARPPHPQHGALLFLTRRSTMKGCHRHPDLADRFHSKRVSQRRRQQRRGR